MARGAGETLEVERENRVKGEWGINKLQKLLALSTFSRSDVQKYNLHDYGYNKRRDVSINSGKVW